MSRKGYASEYIAKQALMVMYGKDNVIKVAIGQFGGDFICIINNRIDLVVEVKECHGKKYYRKNKDKSQIQRISEFCKSHDIRFQLWIHYPKHQKWEYETDIEL